MNYEIAKILLFFAFFNSLPMKRHLVGISHLFCSRKAAQL